MLNIELQQYYSIKFDLLIFIYEFPPVGELFHEYAEDFLKFIGLCMQAC